MNPILFFCILSYYIRLYIIVMDILYRKEIYGYEKR